MSKTHMLLSEKQAFDRLINLNTVFLNPTSEQKTKFVDPIVKDLKSISKYGIVDYRYKVIEAFTGSGKTTVLTKYILNEIQGYVNGALILAPTTQLVEAMMKDGVIDRKHFKPVWLNSRSIDEYVDHDAYKRMPVFVATSQFFIKNVDKFQQLLNALSEIDSEKLGLAVFVDEAHKGVGTSSDMTAGPNFGQQVRPGGFDAVTFEALMSLNETGDARIYCFSATPTLEQKGKIPDHPDLLDYPEYFDLLSRYERDPAKSPFVRIHHVQVWPEDHKVRGKKQASAYIEEILEGSGIFHNFRERNKLRRKLGIRLAGMMIKVSRKPKNQDFIPIKEIEKQLIAYIKKTSDIYDWSDVVVARNSTTDKIIDGKLVDADLYVDAINRIKDRPVIQLVVDALTVGTDFPFVSDIVTLGVPQQVDPKKIGNDEWNVAAIEQFVGRGMRTGLAPYDFLIEELGKMNLSKDQEELILDKITELVTTNVYFPALSDIHSQLTTKILSETYLPEDGRAFLDALLYGEKQINYGGTPNSKVIRIRQKTVQDHTNFTKQFKQKYCGYHEEACFELAYMSYKKSTKNPMSKEDYLNSELWDTQLHVDHKDGNRNNNDPSNFETLCANAHAEKTIRQGDCYNNYQLK